jgi:DNA-binding XRE family transcriptional regulator
VDASSEGAPPPEFTLARRLNHLFNTTIKSVDKRGRPVRYSTPEVANAITDDPSHPVSISRVTLWKVREGKANPTMEKVRAIAKFFDDHRPEGAARVTAAWLLAEGDEPVGRTQDALPERAEQVRQIAMRAGRMSPERLRMLVEMIEVIDPAGDVEFGRRGTGAAGDRE